MKQLFQITIPVPISPPHVFPAPGRPIVAMEDLDPGLQGYSVALQHYLLEMSRLMDEVWTKYG